MKRTVLPALLLIAAMHAAAAPPAKKFSVVEASIPDMQAALRDKRIT